jgi:hypothetical protein
MYPSTSREAHKNEEYEQKMLKYIDALEELTQEELTIVY